MSKHMAKALSGLPKSSSNDLKISDLTPNSKGIFPVGIVSFLLPNRSIFSIEIMIYN